jgi:alpha-ketoglutarate-dependent taurine dioxygenase
LPWVITPERPASLRELSGADREQLEAQLLRVGAVLLRGFTLRSALDLREFASSFGAPLASYEFASTPRRKVAAGVYSSTEYPAHQSIPLHNEQSYTRSWPSRLWFACLKPAAEGGATPIADSRRVFERIPPSIRSAFRERGLLYVRNYGEHLDVPWQRVFGTDDQSAVEQYCAEHSIECSWKANGGLRTAQRCQAVLEHPRTGESVWFNQAHLFHVSSLPDAARRSLLETVGEAELPRNVYYGDGAALEEQSLAAVRRAYDELSVSFPWHAGDVLMVDNLLVAHGREPFRGDRKVVVAMA